MAVENSSSIAVDSTRFFLDISEATSRAAGIIAGVNDMLARQKEEAGGIVAVHDCILGCGPAKRQAGS